MYYHKHDFLFSLFAIPFQFRFPSRRFDVTTRPQMNLAVAIRAFLMIWAFYCINVSLIFQSQLVVILSMPATPKQIRTPSEIISTGTPHGFPQPLEVSAECLRTFVFPRFAAVPVFTCTLRAAGSICLEFKFVSYLLIIDTIRCCFGARLCAS